MSDRAEIETASALFTRTIREVRAHPDRFAAGLELIRDRFSTKTIRAKAEADLDDIEQRAKGGRGIPPFVVDRYRGEVKSASEPMWKIGELRGFIATLPFGMDRAEAQAALLMIAWAADDEPNYSIGLPALLESWITEHWKGRRQPDKAERIASNRQTLRELRRVLTYDAKLRDQLVHVGRLAWDRMEAAGWDSAPPVPLENPRGTPPRIAHADDFTWLRVAAQTYEFKKGRQARVVGALFESWEQAGRTDGHGLTETTLADKAGSSGSFRMLKVFAGHPALRGILRSPAKGTWALYLNEPTAD